MPLHGHPEVEVRQLDGLHGSIICARGDDEAFCHAIDRLVVVRLADDRPADQAGDVAVGIHQHMVVDEHPAAGVVALRADHVGQVLVESATERHIQHLGTAADSQKRQVPGNGGREQAIFPGVTVTARFVCLGMRDLPVARRIDIFAAADDESVESVEHSARDCGIDSLGRQQHGDAAGAIDRIEVHLREEGSRHIPDPRL